MWTGIFRPTARALAAAKVCSSDWEIISQIFPRFRQESQQVGGYHALFAKILSSEITSQAVEVDSKAKPFEEGPQVFLSENARYHSRQDVPRTTSCHSRITRCIDVNGAIGCGNNRSIAFEDDVCVPG